MGNRVSVPLPTPRREERANVKKEKENREKKKQRTEKRVTGEGVGGEEPYAYTNYGESVRSVVRRLWKKPKKPKKHGRFVS